ncbi:aromatic ring-hydroxylating dioxygenase subunit alpha [Sphingomonas sp. 35-24ZXX]|uniref:aromatic ring-hydroxylating dioxygenase subunit alpha n=1 Tax=Sphingomonas sp. 35-24ZXX TaxID=1545915 RepID=UPI00053BDFC3|nr:aromatic ring-hydroxylating dioxygenase subunit alpha [Sphingomonas sp. 35-24ZXX]
MGYLRNTWYAAGFSGQLGDKPIVRTMLDEPVVLYRTEDGTAVAMSDRCPHRSAPLHQGQVFGDAIRCPYHGLRFGPDGACVDNPVGDRKLPRARNLIYPLREVNGILWVWFGDREPDESAIVRFDLFDDPGHWATVEDMMPVAAAYTLVSDNLLDLSHAEFLHPALATEGFNRRTQFSVSQEGEVVIGRNWRPGEPISPLFRFGFGEGAPDHVDHRSITRWHAPANLSVEVGATPPGEPESAGLTLITAHLVTPETETTCHYFWRVARDFKREDSEFSKRLHDLTQQAFEREDKPMIEAQQRYMGSKRLEDLKPIWLTSDAASGRARKVLEEKLAGDAA